MEEKMFEELIYLISYPENFNENEKYPLVVFLHGRGARSATTDKLHQYSSLKHLKSRQNERGITSHQSEWPPSKYLQTVNAE